MRFAATLASSLLALLLVGCPTTSNNPKPDDTEIIRPPVTTAPQEIEFDENNQNAGIVGYAPGGGFLVTPRLRERFLALADRYGHNMAPPLSATTAAEFLIPAAEGRNYVITAEGMVRYLELVDRAREDRQPRP